MNRQEYKAKIKELEATVFSAVEDKQWQLAKIKELEEKIINQQKELNTMISLWSQVVAHSKKDDDVPKRMKILGGGFTK
jgi:hypothetical protein